MLRVLGAVGLAFLALTIALPAGARPLRGRPAKAPGTAQLILTIRGPATPRAIPPGFLGLSFEYWAARDYAGDSPRHVNPVFLQLIRNLAGASAPVLRVGGVTTDTTWSPTPGATKPAGAIFALTRRWRRTIGALAARLGARLILGINFEADSPQIARAEARALVTAVGRGHVEALELGNEPELYGVFTWGFSGAPGRPADWDFAAFDRDYSRIGDALPRGLPLAGPTVGQPNWFGYLSRFLSDQPRVAIATVHRYPLQECFLTPSNIKFPSIPHLLAPAASRGLADSVAQAVRTAHARHVALRIDEMNTLSCGEMPAVTQSFASALWSLDVLFEMARVGVDGVNIHTYPGTDSELFTFRRVHGRWRAAVEPDYYGLAMFAQAAPAGARLLKVSPAVSGQLKAWATRAPDGTIRLVLINEGTQALRVAVRAPGAPAGIPGTLERLEAPGIAATGGVTLAGQRYGAATGLPVGSRRTEAVAPGHHGYVFRVPDASAVTLTIG